MRDIFHENCNILLTELHLDLHKYLYLHLHKSRSIFKSICGLHFELHLNTHIYNELNL